ncbi:MAG: CDP-glycerol glycerophosphotransferase family protein [Shewanella sp.]|nr:CDP-glycerol glycerophosphotransferase family protein [Shewanella sp.]MCF1432155.1 CDP-glycerol glycerophosphotransferase family protein [Shewanella sp.]MCF1438931.1 CDP-glycerol glycerophosphotransferase family protein [Shewanella sp.]MCF1458178.1 CDP-glycerol glycerophosphotransferase family protein [Shewanella sp.]
MYISQNYSFAILRPLQAEILRQGGEVKWFVEGKDVNLSYFHASESLLADIDDVIGWCPDAVFVPGNVVPNFIPGLKVAVFHGFNAGKLNRRGREDHFEIRGCFDLYCTQGPNTTQRFQELAQLHRYFTVAETGWPMIDPLFQPIENNPYKDPADNRKTLLICSTFSRNLTCAPHLYEQVKRFAAEGKWRILVQFHPKMDKQIVEQYKQLQGPNLTFVETDNVLPLLQAADVMLCDTSSVLLMFLLQHKPVVTFRNVTGAAHLLNVEDADKVEEAIDYAMTYPVELMAKIDAYCQELHPYRDGQSSSRVLAAVNEQLEADPLARKVEKPANLLRMLKLRKKLHYWKRTKGRKPNMSLAH